MKGGGCTDFILEDAVKNRTKSGQYDLDGITYFVISVKFWTWGFRLIATIYPILYICIYLQTHLPPLCLTNAASFLIPNLAWKYFPKGYVLSLASWPISIHIWLFYYHFSKDDFKVYLKVGSISLLCLNKVNEIGSLRRQIMSDVDMVHIEMVEREVVIFPATLFWSVWIECYHYYKKNEKHTIEI